MNATPEGFRVRILASALRCYLATGMKVNTAYTLTNMLNTAGNITGKAYKKSQGKQALADLEALIQ